MLLGMSISDAVVMVVVVVLKAVVVLYVLPSKPAPSLWLYPQYSLCRPDNNQHSLHAIRYTQCTEYAQLPSIAVCHPLNLSLYSKEIPFTLHLQSSNPIHPPSPVLHIIPAPIIWGPRSPVLSTFGPQLTHVN